MGALAPLSVHHPTSANEEVEEATAQHVRLVVCSHATDAADALDLMQVIGVAP